MVVTAGTGHTITGNSLFGNDGPAIAFSGSAPVDPPTITRVTTNDSTTVEGTLQGLPSSTYTVEVFATPTCRIDGLGESQIYLGTVAVTLDAAGQATFTARFDTTFSPRHFITATATDVTGSTSALSACNNEVKTAIEQVSSGEVPSSFRLHENYPNPFNPETTIRYDVPQASPVRLAVYDLLGREVAVLVDEQKTAGSHTVVFDARDLASGLYLYQLTSNEVRQTRKLVLLK